MHIFMGQAGIAVICAVVFFIKYTFYFLIVQFVFLSHHRIEYIGIAFIVREN